MISKAVQLGQRSPTFSHFRPSALLPRWYMARSSGSVQSVRCVSMWVGHSLLVGRSRGAKSPVSCSVNRKSSSGVGRSARRINGKVGRSLPFRACHAVSLPARKTEPLRAVDGFVDLERGVSADVALGGIGRPGDLSHHWPRVRLTGTLRVSHRSTSNTQVVRPGFVLTTRDRAALCGGIIHLLRKKRSGSPESACGRAGVPTAPDYLNCGARTGSAALSPVVMLPGGV